MGHRTRAEESSRARLSGLFCLVGRPGNRLAGPARGQLPRSRSWLGDALLAIVIGSVLGCLLLALVGIIGSDNAIPTMVLLRPVLGVRGSYLPTLFNVLQLIGWTIFEFVVMGFAADAISQALFGVLEPAALDCRLCRDRHPDGHRRTDRRGAPMARKIRGVDRASHNRVADVALAYDVQPCRAVRQDRRRLARRSGSRLTS